MAGSLTVERIVPSPHVLQARISRFAEQPEGIVTAFSDSALRLAKDSVGEDAWVEFEPFPTLIRRYLTLTGAESPPIPNARLREMAIARSMMALPVDNVFAAARSFAGSHQALAKTLEELHGHGIDGHRLREIAKLVERTLARRLDDLADIEQMTADTLRHLGFGGELELIRACREAIPDYDDDPAPLLVIAGDRFPALRADWLAWLAGTGVNITLLTYRHATRDGFFPEADELSNFLVSRGARVSDLGGGSVIAHRLFGIDRSDLETPADVQIYAEANEQTEVEQALRRANESPSNSVIAVRNPGLLPWLEVAAQRLGIRLSYVRRDELLSNRFARRTLDLLEALASDDIRDLGNICHGVHRPDETAADRKSRLEIARQSTQEPDPWAHFEKEIALRNLPGEAWILQVLDWRNRTSGFIAARDWLTFYQELRDMLPWQDLAARESIIARDAAAAVVMEQCLAAHASVASLSEDARFDLREFTQSARRAWNRADYAVEHLDIEAVRLVTDIDSLPAAATVVAIGLSEGSFPRRPKADPVLSDHDRIQIALLAPDLVPLETAAQTAVRERTDFYRLAESPGRNFIASYPVRNGERPGYPAVFLDRLAEAAGVAMPKLTPGEPMAPADSPLVADQALLAALTGPRRLPEPVAISNRVRELVAARAAEPVRYWNIYWAIHCPFRFVMSERTRLRARNRHLRWRMLADVPANARLALTPATDLERQLKESLETAFSDWSPATLDWELRTLEESRESLTEGWAQRERDSRNRWNRLSTRTNVSLDSLNDRLQRKLPGLNLKGTVPAVSETSARAVAQLYEVGSPPNLPDDPYRWWQYSLLWLAFENPKGKGAGIEIDFTNGIRLAVTVGELDGDGFGMARSNESALARLSPPDSTGDNPTQDLRVATFDFLKQAYDAMKSGDAVPIPGHHCGTCQFGELCRRHQKFGDLNDPFIGGI